MNGNLGLEPTHLHVNTPQALKGILAAEVNVAIWRRRPAPDLVAAARSFAASEHQLACTCSAESLVDTMTNELSKQRFLSPVQSDVLVADIDHLARLYTAITTCPTLNVRLEVLRNDGCRRFHTDNVALRLLCTYWGRGTQWLANEDVDRATLASGGDNSVIALSKPRELDTGWVALFKGDAGLGSAGNGAVHRSPPIGEEGSKRVLVCIDGGRWHGCE